LLKAVDHAKKTALKGAWVRHTLFQGKRLSSEHKEQKNDLTLKRPLLEGTHQSLSSLPLLIVTECKTCRKDAKTPISQSCASLVKLTFHWIEPPRSSTLAATEVSFDRAILKRTGKASLRTVFPYHRSCQNLILVPSPTTSLEKLENDSQPFLMFFYNPTPKVLASLREHHPLHKLPYFESTTILHQVSLSIP